MSKVYIAWHSTDAHAATVDADKVTTDGKIDDNKVSEWVSENEGSDTFTWDPVVDRDIHTVRLVDNPDEEEG